MATKKRTTTTVRFSFRGTKADIAKIRATPELRGFKITVGRKLTAREVWKEDAALYEAAEILRAAGRSGTVILNINKILNRV